MKSLPALLLLLPSLLSAERPLAVQGAVDSELQPLLEALGRPPAREIDGYSFWEGRLEGRRVVVSRTEVGMVHAAVATTLLIREYAPELIINQGTAGAVNPDLQVGDIVIGTASVPFGAFRTRARPLGAGVDLDGWSPMPRRLRIGGERVAMERFPSDVDWVERVAKTAHPGGRVLRGVVGSADQWNREMDKLLWARNVFGIDSEDMESAAVAQVSRSFGVPFVPVRIISNSELLGAEFQVETGAVCARFVLRFLEAFVGAPGSSAPSFSAKFEEIKRQATPVELYAFLYDLPKGGDLHNHLGGSGLAETWFRLATDKARNGGREYFTRLRINNCGTCPAPLIYFHTIQEATWKALPPCCRSEYEPMSQLSPEQKQAWMSSVKLDRPQEGRHEFFEVIWSRLNDLLRDATVISELMVENMKLFGREGVRYIEWQLGPFLRTEGSKTLEPDELSRLFRARLEKPDAKETGVEVRLLANVLRFAPDAEQRIEEAYAFVDGHRDLWVGINLVGREDNDKGYPLRFLKTFRRMRRRYSNIGLAIHGGEVDEPNRHVRDTLLLGATRIGHGLNLVTDPETLLLMRGGRYLVEHSLVSNQLLEYTPDLDEHPFPEYLRLGIPVSLATDDRGMWDSNLTDEYFSAVGHFNLSWEELVQIGRNSLEFAFLDAETKAQLMASYESDVAAFEKKYAGGDWRELLTGVGPAVSGYAERSFGIERN